MGRRQLTRTLDTVSNDTGLLGQIAADVRALTVKVDDVAVRVTAVETVLRELRDDAHDHEQRLRALERTRPQLLPRTEYEADRDRHSRRFWWVLTAAITVLVAVVGPIEAVLLSRLFG